MLQTRLAAAESMTHDVIRDLLGVKLDITNYAVRFSFTFKLWDFMVAISHCLAFFASGMF